MGKQLKEGASCNRLWVLLYLVVQPPPRVSHQCVSRKSWQQAPELDLDSRRGWVSEDWVLKGLNLPLVTERLASPLLV